MFHLRESHGRQEVDLLLEAADGRVVALEQHPFDMRACIESAFDLVTEPAARKTWSWRS